MDYQLNRMKTQKGDEFWACPWGIVTVKLADMERPHRLWALLFHDWDLGHIIGEGSCINMDVTVISPLQIQYGQLPQALATERDLQ